MMQMANVGPYCGQLVHFSRYAPQVTCAYDRYKTIVHNTLDAIERRLGRSPIIGVKEYTVADMAFLPWVHSPDFFLGEGASAAYPKIKDWAGGLNASRGKGAGTARRNTQPAAVSCLCFARGAGSTVRPRCLQPRVAIARASWAPKHGRRRVHGAASRSKSSR
jgi:hypothetical protein